MAQEAARLAEALGRHLGAPAPTWAAAEHAEPAADVADDDLPVGEGAAGAREPGSSHSEHGRMPCDVCPICQGAALLRRVSPELVGRVADAAGLLATGLREWADRAAAEGATGRTAEDGTAADPTAPEVVGTDLHTPGDGTARPAGATVGDD